MTSDLLSNLWQNSATEHFSAPALDQDVTVDLVVIGGGFTGCSAALEAARQGASVCLLEADDIGDGGSGRNVGLVNAGLWLPPDTVIDQMGERAGRHLVDVLGEAPGRVFSLIEREKIDCEATRQGTLHLAHAPSGVENLKDRYEQGRRFGAPLELLDEAETHRRTGSAAFKGALYDPRAGTIQPLAYCRGLARAATRAGAGIHTQSKVTQIDFNAGAWTVKVNGKSVRAKALLLATNAYHSGIPTPFKPTFSTVSYSQFATQPLPEAARRDILRNREGCWDTALIMSSFRMDQANRLIVGGVGNIEGFGSRVHRNWARSKLSRVFPALADIPFEHAWRGNIAMTGDHIPKIVEFGPSAFACFGYSGRGIGPGTVFGTATANALLNSSHDGLPVVPIVSHSDRFTALKTCYYEVGATLTHMVKPLQRF